MRDHLFLAWQYLRHHRFTTAVLIASITLIVYLPAALQVIVSNAERHFRARAASTPLLVGPRSSPLELVLGSVYFDKPREEVMRFEQVERIESQSLGEVIPLHTRFVARDSPIVGTTEGYFQLRGLRIAQGESWSMLGQCVLGASVARRLELGVGDRIPVSKTAGLALDSPPLRMEVVGVFSATETPDDEAVFVELETAWIIEGLGHGHVSGAQHGSSQAKLYTDITKDNVESFHFRGDHGKFPITALIVIPESERSETILLGQYFSPEETAQIVQPQKVMDRLLERVVMIRSYMIAIIAIVSLVSLLTMAMVVVLSIRLRRAELVTISKMGCSRFTIASILGSQIAIIIAFSTGIAFALTVVTNLYGPELVRWLIL